MTINHLPVYVYINVNDRRRSSRSRFLHFLFSKLVYDMNINHTVVMKVLFLN